jgi:hypothetical protein
MSTIKQNAQLMLLNKMAQVEALHEAGFPEVTMATPLSEIVKYMKWCGGLLDLTIACVEKSTGAKAFFTGEAWSQMSATGKAKYVRSGVRIRAQGKQYVLASADCQTDSATSYKWGPTGEDIAGLTNYAGSVGGLYDDFDYRANTDAILAQGESKGTTHPAAEAAGGYQTCTEATDGVADPWSWGLPTVGILMMMYRYKAELNAFFETYFGTASKLANDLYWSSNEYSASNAWVVSVSSGYVLNLNNWSGWKDNARRVRAVSAV